MSRVSLIGAQGPIRLGSLIGKGAEGAVYELPDNPDKVAKVYLDNITVERGEKLALMQTILTPELASLTAWPTELLKKSDGRIGGFLMRRMSGSKDIHSLYSPKSRLAEFPEADWRMLVRAALNMARAFHVIHSSGCLVGDVNHGGIRVASDATVRVIDCDSFQVSSGGKLYLCEVGTDQFTPPELQGRSFKQVPRTSNHDNFGLAVLIFSLLQMGRHPFAGRYSGSEDMPIPRAIGQFRYAYGSDKSATGMAPPPNTAPAIAASPEVAELWEQAFGHGAIGTSGRPSAQRWVAALSNLERNYARCSKNPSHYYFAGYGKCPWCPIEQIGVILFGLPGLVVSGHDGGAVDVESLWKQILGIPSPGALPPVPSSVIEKPSREARAVRTKRIESRMLGLAFGVVAFLVGALVNGQIVGVWFIVAIVVGLVTKALRDPDVSRFRVERDKASSEHNELVVRYESQCGTGPFDGKLSELRKIREKLLELPAVRQRKHSELMSNRRAHAFQKFLDGHRIERANISGVGPMKKAMLESYGIESAADLNSAAILQVPGFGSALAQRLMDWRSLVEGKFRFDPNTALDRSQIMALDRSIAQTRMELERGLANGLSSLRQTRQTLLDWRKDLLEELGEAAIKLAQATANFNAVS